MQQFIKEYAFKIVYFTSYYAQVNWQVEPTNKTHL